MSKILCNQVHHECCETKYNTYCMTTKSGDTKGKCRKIIGGPTLEGVQPEHLIVNYKGVCKTDSSKNSKQSGNNAGTSAAAAAGKSKKNADEEKRKEEIRDAIIKRRAAAEAAAKAAAEEAEMNKILAQIAAAEEAASLQEAVLSEQEQLVASRGNSCVRMPFYENIANSCYMDSIIFSLLAFPNEFVVNYFLKRDIDEIRKIISDNTELEAEQIETIIQYVEKIQKILRKINGELQSKQLTPHLNNVPVAECFSLRRELLKNPLNILEPYSRDFHFGNASQEDASEFVEALFRTFFIENLTTTETITYRSSKYPDQTKQPRINTSQTYPIYQVALDCYDFDTPEFILSKTVEEKLDESNFLRGDENVANANRDTAFKNNKYPKIFDIKNTETKLEVSDAPQDEFMILQLKRFENRFTDSGRPFTVKNTTPIKPPQTLRLNEDSAELQLNNIIVHLGDSIQGGHYIAYFKCNDNWYLYNDMIDTIERIGTYKQLLKHRILRKDKRAFSYPGTLENNCYLLFYGINDQRI